MTYCASKTTLCNYIKRFWILKRCCWLTLIWALNILSINLLVTHRSILTGVAVSWRLVFELISLFLPRAVSRRSAMWFPSESLSRDSSSSQGLLVQPGTRWHFELPLWDELWFTLTTDHYVSSLLGGKARAEASSSLMASDAPKVFLHFAELFKTFFEMNMKYQQEAKNTTRHPVVIKCLYFVWKCCEN